MGGGHLGAWGGVPTHMHMHMHACTCTHAHLYMYRNCKWPPTWRHPYLACLACLTCMCMHVCVHGIPPTPIHPSATPQGVDPQNHLKFDNTSTYQDISILFEDLKSVKNSPPMGGCVFGGWVGGWVVGWVDGWGQVKSLKI